MDPAVPLPTPPRTKPAPIGEPLAVLLVTAEPGRFDEARAGLRELGATEISADGGLGYLRVAIASELVGRASALPGVQHADVDQPVPMDNPRPDA